MTVCLIDYSSIYKESFMKLFYIVIIKIIFLTSLTAQSYNMFVDGLASEANLDTLVKTVRILSGEDSVIVDGNKTLIKSRNRNVDNELAANFIKQKLTQYGLEVKDQVFSETGRNVYAIQKGSEFPESYYLLTAHYDAVTDYAADDNASGTSVVIEAARLLKEHQPGYSIIYVLFDDEEIGLYGSRHFAAYADSNDMDIKGVLNFDMLGWDSNNDWIFEIHASDSGSSQELAEYIYAIDDIYDLPLEPIIYNPGTNRSDHAPFWDYGYSSVLFIEALYSSDFNQFYHGPADRIDKFNLSYFHSLAQLGIASLVSLAFESNATYVQTQNEIPESFSLSNYPNPFNPSTTIAYSIPVVDALSPVEVQNITLRIYDILGNEVATLVDENKSPGSYQIRFDASDLSSGLYIYNLTTLNGTITNKMLLVK